MKEMVGGCCVCSDERGWPDNPLVYCDGPSCTVAVHQACYGIVTVPTGPWFCRKCECPENKGKVRCELCPSKSGALKRTDTGGWAHVVCALYIPEVRFGNVTSMEPIVLRLIPAERYNKTCYICQDAGKTHRANAGACMQCNKSGCKQQFHVTCAQSLGLLCEEAGNYLDNVKYCGYCQHHYSKLKKGGNVKTIPPYKPVSHESQSSDSSEKEGDASPRASGSGTPTHPTKAKGLSRKSSHSSGATSGKNTPTTSKAPTCAAQQLAYETGQQAMDTSFTPAARKHKSGDKNGKRKSVDKKKSSPSRRGSSTGDGGSSSKSNTPAPSPSPQHPPADPQPSNAKAVGPTVALVTAKIPLPAASPSASKPPEPPANVTPTVTATVTSATASLSPAPPLPLVSLASLKPTTYVEPAISNIDMGEHKQTKKRKAVSAASTPNRHVDYVATPPHSIAGDGMTHSGQIWDSGHSMISTDMEVDKITIKKAKTEDPAMTPSHFACLSPAPPPPPPPPAHSPAQQPSPRHLPSPMPGPSGMNTAPVMRSPSQLQREMPPSLLVSVPLPSASHGLNLSAHTQVPLPPDLPPPQNIYHQPIKQASMDPSVPGHSPHSVHGRSPWGGLNVAYELQPHQQDPKAGLSGIPGSSKDIGLVPLPPAMRTKKRAAVASAVAAMSVVPPPMSMQAAAQSLASVRRQPQPTPPPMYQEIKDSPPSSPGSERPLKPKLEHNLMSSRMGMGCGAPHMLGNELNPESGAAARLQEQLSAELAAHAAGVSGMDPLIPPPLINKAVPLHLQCGVGMGMGMGRTASSAQSLDQLLERQWEQGSQFLMEQAQHFDIASLLSCLHQLRTENVRLEDHVGSLLQRRDHLLAVNARLAIPLTSVMGAVSPDAMRCPRDSGPQMRATPGPVRPNETITSERSHQLMMREVQQKPS